MSTSKVEPSHICEECGCLFTQRKNLNRHLRKFHKGAGNLTINNGKRAPVRRPRNSRITCPECREQVTRYSALRKHLEEVHEIALNQERMEFPSEQEFQQWKQKYESQNASSYILNTAPKIMITGEEKRYYHCHRSYSYQSQTTQKNRKNIGTNKIGANCPSVMELTITNNYVLTFWTTHVGHTLDVGHTFLKKQTRAEIADRLSQGVSFQKIIDGIRKSAKKEEGLQRVHLVKRKDLHNIIRDFNITYDMKSGQDDAVSKLRVNEMKELGNECPAIYYKVQNRDDDSEDESDNLDVEQDVGTAKTHRINKSHRESMEICREELKEFKTCGITLNNEERSSGMLLKKKLALAMRLCEKNKLNSNQTGNALRTVDKLIEILNERLC